MDQRQHTESRHIAGTTVQHTRYRYGALRPHDDAGNGGRSPWSAAESGWPARRRVRGAGAVRIEWAVRLHAEERELSILKEHGQWPLRRSYVLASTAAALAPTHFFAVARGGKVRASRTANQREESTCWW